MLSHSFALLSGTANPQLAKAVGSLLSVSPDHPVSLFANGEVRITLPHNIRRNPVYIIQPTSTPVNDHIMQLLLMIDAAKRASASEINAIIPYFGYCRQDRKERSRVPISSALVAKMLQAAGVTRILTLDIHSDQQQGFFDGPWDNLFGSYSLVPHIKKRKLKNLIVAAPDKGGVPRAIAFAKRLEADGIAIVYKERDLELSNQSEAMDLIGNVKDKNVLIADDIIDTGGTIINAANLLLSRGATNVYVCATHGLFSGNALDHVKASAVKEWFITDGVAPNEEILKIPKITICSVAPLIAEAIKRMQTGKSLSEGLIL